MTIPVLDRLEAGDVRAVALDGHVHFYPGADLSLALSAGRKNLVAGAAARGFPAVLPCLMLTETVRENAFAALRSGEMAIPGWQLSGLRDDPAALVAADAEGRRILLVAGRQIVTAEKIEVLAFGMTGAHPDGRPLADVLAGLAELGHPAVLPWGLGKWLGRRGATLSVLVAEGRVPGRLLGDNAGRPPGWRSPLLAAAAAAGIPVLPGTDPLPVPGAEAGIGRFGGLLDAPVDPARPAQGICARLAGRETALPVLGRRSGLARILSGQRALRRRRAAPAIGPEAAT
ncbi:hypothetical protein [Poseidonocella sp. HB161398]|uniref:hypothetical protein n=1 Tax=Poseidonocella sp. HB161398 TaxID=2320855 RepID=UPI0014870CD1|nr:hypothetical protein [Poseidonocella sp. HB161398]